MSSLKQSAISGVKWTSLSTVVIGVLQLVQLAALARLLSPTDFGLMAMTMVLIGFAQAYADMGISAAIVQRQAITHRQLSSLYWLNIIAGTAVFILVCAATPLAVLLFDQPLLSTLLPVVAVSFPLSAFGLQFHRLLERDLRFNTLAKQEMTSACAGSAVAVVSAFLGQGVWSLVWGQMVSTGTRTALLVWTGWRRWPPMLHFARTDLHGFISFGLYQMGERSINYFNSRIDQLLVGSLLGAQELGYYNFAFNLVMQPINTINPILTRVAFPVFARIQDKIDDLRTSYLKMINLLASVGAPLMFGLAAVAPLLVPLVFGAKWEPAVLLVQVLAFYAFLRSIGNPVGSLLLARGRADLGFRWNFMLLFTTTPLIFAGAKLGGALGIALALALLLILYSVANYLFLIRRLIGGCAGPYAVSLCKPALLAAIMGSAVWLLIVFGWDSSLWLFTTISTGALAYFALLRFFDRTLLFEVRDMLTGVHS